MFDAYKRFFRFSGAEKGTWYKGMAFELLRSIFEALQFVALLIVLRALVGQNMTGATAWTALGIMAVSVAGAAFCWYLAHNSEGHANYRMCGEKRIHIVESMKYMPMGYFNAQSLGSLWICNSFFAQKELSDWAGGELYAVLAVGYADEAPEARLRKRTEDVIEWRV